MDLGTKLELVKSFAQEIVTEEELKNLFETKKNPIAYDGFEPSGIPHIAQGVMRAININKLTSTGVKFKMLIADWHAWANNKLGGNLENIQTTGDFFIEIWKASGLDLKNVEFVKVNDFINDSEYWKKVVSIARNTTINRIMRCGQIMGRKEGSVLQSSQILYPCMQAADIFHLEADICQLGMDQRKVNMLAREIGPKLFSKKPVAVHHYMLMGLGQPPKSSGEDRVMDLKMSKSKPDTAIFMTDTVDDVKRKLQKAYCPEGVIEENPILDYYKQIIFEKYKTIKVERPQKFGGDLTYDSFDALAKDFKAKKVHPLDVKNTAAEYINKILEPVRQHFEKNKKAKELFSKVKSFQITR
ncbi:tyrosine--tRNA ligase [Candidatus Woesearchaeota archaeon]|nr:tyrosine--tRNA ligase [Candidatus Woesearchaeota archaeon]